MLRKNQIEKKSTLHSGRKSVQVPHHPRAIGRSENPEGPVVMWWVTSVPLVEKGLVDLPKYGGYNAPPRPPAPTALHLQSHW